jgi:hypothetical protein
MAVTQHNLSHIFVKLFITVAVPLQVDAAVLSVVYFILTEVVLSTLTETYSTGCNSWMSNVNLL